MIRFKLTEQEIILYTGAFLVVAGVLRFFAHSVGLVVFYLSFLPFFLTRLHTIFLQKKEFLAKDNRYRDIVLFIMLVTIILTITGWHNADFLLIFLLMIDYLLVTNKKF